MGDAPLDPHTSPELSPAYELVRTLGKGASGTVFLARERATGRLVALKRLHAARSESSLERFRREAQATARLDHPGIVTVHATGLHEGLPCIVYALVAGTSLREALPTLALSDRLDLVLQAVRAMAYAHERGVLHRDLKPENMLVDGEGRLRVADFGLALEAGQERLTVTGGIVGTPAYMAPELFSGDRAASGPAVDVWSLGVILYEALTGELPFEGQHLLALAALGSSEVDLVPPRARAPDVSPAVQAVCLRALAIKPGARPADAGALLRELEEALAGRGPRRPRRVALTVSLLGGAGLLGLLWLRPAPAPPPPLATRPEPGPSAPAPPAPPPQAPALAPERWLVPGRPRQALVLDGERVLCWGPTGIEVCDLRGGSLLYGSERAAGAAALMEPGLAVVVETGGALHLIGRGAPRPLQAGIPGHEQPNGLVRSALTRLLYAGCEERTAHLDPDSGAMVGKFSEGSWGLAISRDGRRLAIEVRSTVPSPLGAPVVVRELPDGQALRQIFYGRATALQFSRDGQRLFRGLDTGQVQAIDVGPDGLSPPRFLGGDEPDPGQGQALVTRAHGGGVVGLTLSPDGETLWSLASLESGGGELRGWSAGALQQLGTSLRLDCRPSSLDVTPDGALLVIGSERGVLVRPVPR